MKRHAYLPYRAPYQVGPKMYIVGDILCRSMDCNEKTKARQRSFNGQSRSQRAKIGQSQGALPAVLLCPPHFTIHSQSQFGTSSWVTSYIYWPISLRGKFHKHAWCPKSRRPHLLRWRPSRHPRNFFALQSRGAGQPKGAKKSPRQQLRLFPFQPLSIFFCVANKYKREHPCISDTM